jgi:hypothetical protein
VVLAKVDKIKHGDCIRSPITDVCELPITRWNVRKTAPMAA